jgi:hypothetical protein
LPVDQAGERFHDLGSRLELVQESVTGPPLEVGQESVTGLASAHGPELVIDLGLVTDLASGIDRSQAIALVLEFDLAVIDPRHFRVWVLVRE